MTSDVRLEESTIRQFTVRGMTCGSCAARVQRTLGKQPGVTTAEVNYATGTAQVVLSDEPGASVSPEARNAALIRAVAKAGYELAPIEPAEGYALEETRAAGNSATARSDNAEKAGDPPPSSGVGAVAADDTTPPIAEPEGDEARAERQWRRRLVVGMPVAGAVGVLAMVPGPWMHQQWAGWVEFGLATPIQFVMGWPFLREAARRARWQGSRRRR